MKDENNRKLLAKTKFKRFTFWYVLISLPICLIIMFWPLGDMVSTHGKIAHYLAVPLAFISGLIFMGIIFYSSSSGGDVQPNYVEMMERQKREGRDQPE